MNTSTGRRKASIARVRLSAGTGTIRINRRSLADFFPRELHQVQVRQPFEAMSVAGQYDVTATVSGGGSTGQAGAVRLGIARALVQQDEAARPTLRKLGLLTRDPRAKERKKYGQKGARKRFQWVKR